MKIVETCFPLLQNEVLAIDTFQNYIDKQELKRSQQFNKPRMAMNGPRV